MDHSKLKDMAYRSVIAEETLVILKPDACERNLVGTILSRLEGKGLKIMELSMTSCDRQKAEEHYIEHKGMPYFNDLCEYLSSGSVVVAIMYGENAIKTVRECMGPYKNPPAGTIRGDFAESQMRNSIHASANKADAAREIGIWFAGMSK